MSAKRFRVAFSFAGEKRAFVDKVAAILAKRFGREAILYDKYHRPEFARYDLGIYLPKLYSEQSDLIVPVLCPDYDAKRWTGWEWVHIYGLLTKTDGKRVMPSRFEHANADGLSHAAGFIELDDESPEQFATLILQRLALNEGKEQDYYCNDSAPSGSLSDAEQVTTEAQAAPRAATPPAPPTAPARDTEYIPVADKVAAEFDGLKRLWQSDRWLAGGVTLALIVLGGAWLWREFGPLMEVGPGTGKIIADRTRQATNPLAVASSQSNNPSAVFGPTNMDGLPSPKGHTNTLGMVFVPVPGTKVFFSIWETRVQDYAAFAAANPGIDDSWNDPEYQGVKVTPGPTHPVVNVSWEDATNFCAWLTLKERASGRLTETQSYRLPTDAEWSWAVNIGDREGGGTPKDKNQKLLGVYLWGSNLPIPREAGNIGDEKAKQTFSDWTIHTGYHDGFATAAPVGSFPANVHGLFDLSGNVWEWCGDWYDLTEVKYRVLRGGSWHFGGSVGLLASCRVKGAPSTRNHGYGFRCVLE